MIYLVKPTGAVLGSLNGLKEETCNVKRVLTDMWELSFEVNKYIDEKEFKISDYYESISEKMQIWLQTDLIDTMFVIDSEPVISNNGIQETKTITAHTLESELQYKFLRLFYINSGNSTSKEYLAKDNINSYTQLPNEYISLVNFENPELSLLHLVLEGTEWTVDENLQTIEPEMCGKKFTFSVDEQDIYSFLMNTIAQTAQIIFFFDRKNRIVSFRSVNNLGKDTGIFIGLRNLAQQIDIESTSETGLITKYKPTCSENLGVEYVNFGDPYIYNLDYFANTHNEYGDYKYVTKSFHDEYVAWIEKRNDNRQEFINLTKEYNKNLIKIDELKNRLPNDGCSIDYKTFKADELYFSLNAYENALATLITLYKEDYPEKYSSPDIELDEEHLKTTMYWYDYYSYKYQIIPSVLEAMKIWYETDSNGNLAIDDDGKYIVCENGNPAYANNIDIVKPVDSYKYEFELYGLDELQSKKKAWMECVNLLYKDGFIIDTGVVTKYDYSLSPYHHQFIQDGAIWRNPQDAVGLLLHDVFTVTTNKPNTTLKIRCGGNYNFFNGINISSNGQDFNENFVDIQHRDIEITYEEPGTYELNVSYTEAYKGNYIYFILDTPIYNTPDEEGWNILTSQQKSQFTSITAYKENLNNYLDYMSYHIRENSIINEKGIGIIRQCEDAIIQRQTEIDNLQSDNNIVQNQRNTLSSSVIPENNFSSDNLKIFRLLIHEANYSNENIVVTSLDDILTKIDIAEELYKDSYNNLAIVSQPQYSFKTTIDNLFALEEFVPLHKDMDIGNFVRLMPDLFSDDFVKLRLISIGTNPLMNTPDISIDFSTMTKSLSDMSDLTFFMDENNSGHSNGSSSGSSGGTYGKNDAEIQIANNMLNALLKTETFGTQVSDVILDSIRANSGNFKKLISHSGIFDTLESGEVKVNGACLTDIIKSLNYIAKQEGSMFNLKDGSIDFAGGSLTYDKDKGLIIKGAKGKTSIDGSSVNTGAIVSNNYNGTTDEPLDNTEGSIIDLTDGQFNFGGGKLKFEEDTLSVEGDITANNLIANKSGTIAGWYFDATGFYKLNSDGTKQMVIGDNGISAGETFHLNSNGTSFISGDLISVYDTSIDLESNIVPTNPYIYITLANMQVGEYFKITITFWEHYGTLESNNYGSTSYNLYIVGTIESRFSVDVAYGVNSYNSLNYSDNLTGSYDLDSRELTISVPSSIIRNYDDREPADIEKFFTGGYGDGINKQIKKIIINSTTYNGTVIYNKFGIKLDTQNNNLSGDMFDLFPEIFRSYKNFSFKHYPEFDYINTEPIIQIDPSSLIHKGLTSSSSGTNLASLDGSFVLKSSSSKRYKHDIKKVESDSVPDEINPKKLYDIDVVSYKYNNDYLQSTDQRYDTDIPGFIAEDVYEKYPIACNLDSHGRPEMWEINIMFPAALKLIQEQHEEIEKLKERIEVLEQKIL